MTTFITAWTALATGSFALYMSIMLWKNGYLYLEEGHLLVVLLDTLVSVTLLVIGVAILSNWARRRRRLKIEHEARPKEVD